MKESTKINILNFVEKILGYSNPVVIPIEKAEKYIHKIEINAKVNSSYADNKILIKEKLAYLISNHLIKENLIEYGIYPDENENLINNNESSFVIESSFFILIKPKINL